MTLRILLIGIGTLLAVVLVANIYTLSHMVKALIFSQRRHVQRTIARLDTLKSEGFLQALKAEVTLMTDMVSFEVIIALSSGHSSSLISFS